MSDSQPRWIVASLQEVRIGDWVALSYHRDEVGRIDGLADDHTGRPRVVITEGPREGKTVNVWPNEILLKVHR